MEDFHVFVKPVGARCNLACSYCYYLEIQQIYPIEKTIWMSDDLLEKYIIQHLAASSDPDIFFSWHGGEPTLAGRQFFEKVVEIQRRHQTANCRIINGIQTNGTLLNHEWCKFLKRENFIVGISLDGPESFHTSNRYGKNGQSSFEEVLRGYELLKNYRIPNEILCVVNAANENFPLEIYRFFKSLKAEFITFLPLVENQAAKSGNVSGRSVTAKAFGKFLCTIFDEWKSKDIGTIKVQIFEEALKRAFGLEHRLCIFKKTCGNVPVVELNGDFYSCDHFVNRDHLLGNIGTSTLANLLESPAQKAFGYAKHLTLPRYCLQCEFLASCNGACPKDRFIQSPDGEPGLNYLCEGYKLFFNHCKPFIEQVAKVWQGDQLHTRK
jgi:uncharacterized protein